MSAPSNESKQPVSEPEPDARTSNCARSKIELSSCSALLQTSFIVRCDCTLTGVGLTKCEWWSRFLWIGRLTLSHKHFASSIQTGFICQGVQHRIQNVFVLESEAGNARHSTIRIIVLKREISDLSLDESYRPAVERNAAADGRGLRSNFMCVRESACDRLVRNREKFLPLIVTEDEPVVSVVKVQRPIEFFLVSEYATFVFCFHGRRRDRRRRHA